MSLSTISDVLSYSLSANEARSVAHLEQQGWLDTELEKVVEYELGKQSSVPALMTTLGINTAQHLIAIGRTIELFTPSPDSALLKIHSQLLHGEGFLAFSRQALKSGYIEIPCPWTGKPLRTSVSLMYETPPYGVPGYGYLFNAKSSFYLLISGFASCKIVGVFFPSLNVAVSFGGAVRPKELCVSHIRPLCRLVLRNYALASSQATDNTNTAKTRAPALLIHSYHFAHHLWNELSAIEGLLTSLTGKEKIVLLHSPLADVGELFPEINNSLSRMGGIGLDDVSAWALKERIFWVPLGRQYIPMSLVNKIVHLGECAFPKDVEFSNRIRNSHDLVLWISTRRDLRVWRNQVASLIDLLERLEHSFSSIAIVFDGNTPGRGGMVSNATVQAEQFVIEEIFRKSRVKFTAISLIGGALSKAVVWGAVADYYICNHGTIQHKIAWMHNVPGLCHYFTTDEFVPSQFGPIFAREGCIPPKYLMGVNGLRDEKSKDPRKDLFSYDIDSARLHQEVCALFANHPRQRRVVAPLKSKSMHHLTESYYEEADIQTHIARGESAWASKDMSTTIAEFATALSISPRSKRALDRMLSFLLLNYVSWLVGPKLGPSRVLALWFLLGAFDRKNEWASQRLLQELLELKEEEQFQKMMNITVRLFPDWIVDAKDKLETIKASQDGKSERVRFALSMLHGS